MRSSVERQRLARPGDTVSVPVRRDAGRSSSPANGMAAKILGMQQTLGNQAVQQRASTCPAFPSACPTGGACHTCPARVQAKLTVSQPEDVYEQEADRVAEQVMQMPTPTVQRACATCTAGRPPCPKCEAEKESLVQRKAGAASDAAGASVPDNFLQGLGPGQPLDPSIRAFFEPRFGYDFSQVRVHTDGRVAESARAVNALAYTVGRDVVFGPEQYAPGTNEGQRLLAHELTHVVQQRQGAKPRALKTSASMQTVNVVPEQIQRVSIEDCNAYPREVETAHAEALGGIDRVTGMIQGSRAPNVDTALTTYFGKSAIRLVEAIRVRLLMIRGHLERVTIECENPGTFMYNHFCGGNIAYVRAFPAFFGMGTIHLCQPSFHGLTVRQRAATLIHEAAHRCCAPGDAYYTLNCGETGETRGLGDIAKHFNADSYACLVQTLA